MNFTSDQQKAIDTTGHNILVSAGAGSGKTAVLTERIIQKLIKGDSLSNLVVLTFTKAAADEMKKRVEKRLKEEVVNYPNLAHELDLIDASNISTFDSYCFNLVRKYYYLIGVTSEVALGDSTIFNIEKKRLIDKMFITKITEDNQLFKEFLTTYTMYDAQNMKDIFYTILNKRNNILNKTEIKNLINNEAFCEKQTKYLMAMINEVQLEMREKIDLIFDLGTITAYNSLSDLLFTYVELSMGENYSEIREKSGSIYHHRFIKKNYAEGEMIKIIRDELKKDCYKIAKYTQWYDIASLEAGYLDTQKYAQMIEDILDELEEELYVYKQKMQLFEFNDITRLTIKLLEENPNVLENLKGSINEIMVDEYQDTDDFQNHIMQCLSTNNLFMVGDIKQSIYGFRNANPNNFRNIYHEYEKGNGGELITLSYNFRSSSPVINTINTIFSNVMEKEYGGIDYCKNQELVYGNENYEVNQLSTPCEYIRYEKEDIQYPLKKTVEYEAHIIANNIIAKINNQHQITNHDTKTTKDVSYEDMAILTRGKKEIGIISKVLMSYNIPVDAQFDIKFIEEPEIIVVKNIFSIIASFDNFMLIKGNIVSLLRSYLFEYDDQVIHIELSQVETFDDLEKTLFKDEYFKIKEIIDKQNSYALGSLATTIINDFEVYEKSYRLLNPEIARTRIIHLKQIVNQLGNLEYNIDDLNKYFADIKNLELDIIVQISKPSTNVVKLMTYHKAKGLEFPIVYLPNLDKRFNKTELNERIFFDTKDGYVLQNINKDKLASDNFIKSIVTYNLNKEQVSEEIRMLYVAVTRCSENLILIGKPLTKEQENLSQIKGSKKEINNYHKTLGYSTPFINSITRYNDSEPDFEPLNEGVISNIETPINPIKFKNLEVVLETKVTKKASSSITNLLDEKTLGYIELGTRVHNVLETLDLKNLKDYISTFDEEVNQIIENMSKHDLFTSHINYFQEYEFIYQIDGIDKRGIIDLLLEFDDKYIIVDYKLYDIDKPHYVDQLAVYQEFLVNKTDKPIEARLYSLIQNKFKIIN